jgi:hypothetical protein
MFIALTGFQLCRVILMEMIGNTMLKHDSICSEGNLRQETSPDGRGVVSIDTTYVYTTVIKNASYSIDLLFTKRHTTDCSRLQSLDRETDESWSLVS